MDELTITVTIAGRPYRLKIEKTEEEIVRKAVKQIEEKIKEFSSTYAYKDIQDLLAMVTIQFATSSLNYEKQVDFQDNHLINRLSEIEKVLSENIKEKG